MVVASPPPVSNGGCHVEVGTRRRLGLGCAAFAGEGSLIWYVVETRSRSRGGCTVRGAILAAATPREPVRRSSKAWTRRISSLASLRSLLVDWVGQGSEWDGQIRGQGTTKPGHITPQARDALTGGPIGGRPPACPPWLPALRWRPAGSAAGLECFAGGLPVGRRPWTGPLMGGGSLEV